MGSIFKLELKISTSLCKPETYKERERIKNMKDTELLQQCLAYSRFTVIPLAHFLSL